MPDAFFLAEYDIGKSKPSHVLYIFLPPVGSFSSLHRSLNFRHSLIYTSFFLAEVGGFFSI